MVRRRTPSPELTKLSEVVATWRAQHGGRGSKIPEELWDAAVRVARIDGVWLTAKTLGFKLEGLRERHERADDSQGTKAAAAEPVVAGVQPKIQGGEDDRDQRAQRARRSHPKPAGTEIVAANDATKVRSVGPPPFIALGMGTANGGGPAVIELAGRQGERMRLEVPSGIDVCRLVCFRQRCVQLPGVRLCRDRAAAVWPGR